MEPAYRTIPVTKKLADFVASRTFGDISDAEIKLSVDAITDTFGVALAGSREPIGQILRSVSPKIASGITAPVIGAPGEFSAIDSALHNGAVSHVLDFDDTAHPGNTHVTAHLLPVLVSLGALANWDHERMILAHVIGVELENKLGWLLRCSHQDLPWHPSGMLGTIGAAAAAASLLQLTPAQTVSAFGIATSAASGIHANVGTMTKSLHCGYAARNGIYAAILAQAGFTGSDVCFERRGGYLDLISFGRDLDVSALDELGAPWEITREFGLALKPYPCCGATHTAIEGALSIREELGGKPVASVLVGTNWATPTVLKYTEPKLPLEGKFSMQFCIAAALVNGKIDRQTFTPEVLNDPKVRNLLGSIETSVDERVIDSTEFGTTIRITAQDGSVYERQIDLAKGKRDRWLSKTELKEKFMDCGEVALDRTTAQKVFDLLQDFRHGDSKSGLPEALRLSAASN